jgi:hypothetical protein
MGAVLAVSLRHGHHFSKTPSLNIRLLTGLGVAGDVRRGDAVRVELPAEPRGPLQPV